MGLTAQEQKEMAALEAELKPKASGLTPAEQKEMAALEAELKPKPVVKRQIPREEPKLSFMESLATALPRVLPDVPIPGLGLTNRQVKPALDIYTKGKNAINAGINESVKPPSAPGQGFADIGRAMKTGFNSPTVVSAEPLHNPPNATQTRKLVTKAGNFMVDVAFDPAQALAGGKVGKLADEAFVAARRGAAAQIMKIPAVQRTVAGMQRILNPLKESAAGASVIRGLGYFNVGPQARMMKEIDRPYVQELNVQKQRAANVLQDIDRHSVDMQRDPIRRAFHQDLAAVTKENPVVELVRERMQSLNKPGALKAWEKTVARCKLYGVDPEVVRVKADELRGIYDTAQKLKIKVANGRMRENFRVKENLAEQKKAVDFQHAREDMGRGSYNPSAGYTPEATLGRSAKAVDPEAERLRQTILQNEARLKRLMEKRANAPEIPINELDFNASMSAPHPHGPETPEAYGLAHDRARDLEVETLQRSIKADRARVGRLQAKQGLQQEAAPTLEDAFGTSPTTGAQPPDPNLVEHLGYQTETAASPQGLDVPVKPDQEYERFIEDVLGTKRKRDLTFKQRLFETQPKGASTEIQLMNEAGIRNLIHDLPTMQPEWVQPVTDAIKPGWVGIQEGGMMDPLAGYQMPKSLYNLLQNKLAAAALIPAHQIRSEYIIMKDIREALSKNVLGTVKKIFIGQMPTQEGNLMTNLGQQSLMLRELGKEMGVAERGRLMKQGFTEAVGMKLGKRSGDVERISQHSSSLLQTQIESALGKPSPEFGQLPTVIGSGKFATALPRPQGLTARLFGEGKAGTAAATAFKAAGVVSPVEQYANFQGLSETATKIGSFKILKKLGFDDKEATALVEKYHFDYSDISHAAEQADKMGVWIFNTFPQKQFSQFINTLVNHPSELYRYKRLRDIAVGEDDPSQNKDLPDWMRKSQFTIPLDHEGKDYVNLSRQHPMGGTIDWLANFAQDGFDLNKETMNLLDKPIIAPLIWNLGGHQSFSYDDRSHPPLLQEGQPGNELTGLKLKELAKNYLPSQWGLPGRASQAHAAAEQGIGQTDTAIPRTPEDVNLQYLLGLRVKEAKAPMSALVEREVAKAGRMGPAGAAYAHALAKAWTEPTPADIKEAYPGLDAIRDPVKYQAQFQRLNGYISKLLGSSQVTSKTGKVVNPERLENAAKAFVWFVRSIQEGQQ